MYLISNEIDNCMYIVDEDDVMDLRVAFEDSLQYIQEGRFSASLKKPRSNFIMFLWYK